MKKNFLISTGGSGGHVIPAKILCEHLAHQANLIISTDKRGLKYIDEKKYSVEVVDTPRIRNFLFSPFIFLKILSLTLKSIYFIRKRKIEKVFCTGGYMSIPIIFAAKILNLEIYLIEPNQVLGRANKFFLKMCKKIFCYFKRIKNFPENSQSKIINIFPLVEKNIYNPIFPLKHNKKFSILIVGGSQGAKIFDNDLKNVMVNISKKFPIRIFQQTNENNILNLKNFYNENDLENKIFNFDKNFIEIIRQTDLCITRAGASTLAELSISNIPFIAIPLPTAKDNHQFENAKFYKEEDCCWLLEQSLIGNIEEYLMKILTDKSDYFKKRENLKKLNYQNTWINVNQKILNSINEN